MSLIQLELPLFSLLATPDLLREKLLSMTFTSVSEKRLQSHWLGKVLMMKGQLCEAVAQLTTTCTRYGSHIGTRLDLATCYYLLGFTQMYEKTLNEIIADFKNFQNDLNPINFARSCLLLGKLSEESGYLTESYEIFQSAYEKIEQEFNNPIWIYENQNLYTRLFAEILRFYVQFEYLTDAQKLYAQIILTEKSKLLNFNLDNILHAIFLYNLRVIPNFDQERFTFLTKNMSEQIINLCFHELLEYEIRFNKPKTYIDEIKKYPATNNYDLVLQNLYGYGSGSELKLTLSDIKNIPKAGIIKICFLMWRSDIKLTTDLELLQTSIINSLNSNNQKRWNKWIPTEAMNDLKFQVTLKNGTLYFQSSLHSKKISLMNKPLLLDFLLLFKDLQILSWQELATKLWHRPPNLSDYDRIRMLIKRLNDIHSDVKIFKLQNSFVHKCLPYEVINES